MSDDAKEFISFEEAEKLLPDGDRVHTFRTAGFCMLGADWERAELLDAMRKAPAIEVTGPMAQAMNHGLAIIDDHSPLFIETRTVEVAA